MPSTVNGIGTHYYGKSNVSTRPGICRSCASHTNLQSYDSRLWFVILFVPIFPLRRVRLLEYCPQCSRHYIVNPEEFEMSRQLAVSGAVEKYTAMPSVITALPVHGQMLGHHMHAEADEFRAEVLKRFPASAELREGLASHLEQTSRWNDATPLFEQAFTLNEGLPETRAALAWRRVNENKFDEAYELLDFLRRPGAGQSFNLIGLHSLAIASQRAGQHSRALELFAILLRENPLLGERHVFRKMVATSERVLELSTSILPPRSFSLRGLFDSKSGTYAAWVRWTAFATIVVVLFGFGMASLNEYHRRHRMLQIVNGFATPLQISIDGGAPVVVAGRSEVPISEGKHHIAVTGAVTTQSDIDIESNYWTRWTYNPAWIFNVANVSQIYTASILYTARPQPPRLTWHSSEFVFVPHVDYLFEAAPKSMKVDKNSGKTSKLQVALTPLPPSSTFAMLMARKSVEIAMPFAEGFLERNPNDSNLLIQYVHHSEAAGHERRSMEFLKAGLWRQPVSIPWHRHYQALRSVQGHEAELIAAYDERLKAAPDDATLLYLRARVDPSRAEANKLFQLAYEKNPKLGWPSLSLAFDAANRGEWQEAQTWCDRGLLILHQEPAFDAVRHVVQIANGTGESLEGEYRQRLLTNSYDDMTRAMFQLIEVLAIEGKCDQARQAWQTWIDQIMGSTATTEQLWQLNPLFEYLCRDTAAIRKRMSRAKGAERDNIYFYHSLLAIGEPDAAIELGSPDHRNDDWVCSLSASLAYALAGRKEEADTWRLKACEILKKGDADQKRAAALLEKNQPPSDDELDDVTLRLNDTPLLIATLGQMFPERKADLNTRAERLNVCRMPPALLVKRAISEP